MELVLKKALSPFDFIDNRFANIYRSSLSQDDCINKIEKERVDSCLNNLVFDSYHLVLFYIFYKLDPEGRLGWTFSDLLYSTFRYDKVSMTLFDKIYGSNQSTGSKFWDCIKNFHTKYWTCLRHLDVQVSVKGKDEESYSDDSKYLRYSCYNLFSNYNLDIDDLNITGFFSSRPKIMIKVSVSERKPFMS